MAVWQGKMVTRPNHVLRCATVAACLAATAWASQLEPREPGLRYDSIPVKVAQSLLLLADVGSGDVVYHLGCQDGDIVVTAVRRLRARAVCVDEDARRIAAIRDRARRAGIAERIRFRNEDVLQTSISDATVVVLQLSPAANLELRPKLLRELGPGTVIVSHDHDMGDWKPALTAYVRSGGAHRPLHLWVVPRQ